MRPQQNLTKIDQPVTLTVLLIDVVELVQLTGKGVGRWDDMSGTTTFVFLAVDVPLDLFGWITTVVDIVLFHQALDQTYLIIAIQNLEVLRQLRFTPMLLQQPVSKPVEGTDP